MTYDGWFPFGAPRADARIRLFCFPYAGGGASIFRGWRRAARTGPLDVCPVQLPGREARVREAPIRRLEPLVDALAGVLEPWTGRPYAILGHSMGALVGYELAHHYRDAGLPQPARLIVSGALAPGRTRTGAPIHALPEAAFLAALRDLSGTPEDVLAHRELMELLLPALRADFEVCETYAHRERPPLTCPITVIGGDEDPQVPREALGEWRPLTMGDFETVIVTGGHFFIGARGEEIVRLVRERLVPAGS